MGLGILEPASLAATTDAPGTAFLEEYNEYVHDAFAKHAPGNAALGQLLSILVMPVAGPSRLPSSPLRSARPDAF